MSDSPVDRQFADRLRVYCDGQGTAEDRNAKMPGPPWPGDTNVMFQYLLHRSAEVVEQEGLRAGIAWLGAHAWFEGGLEERARAVGPGC